MISSVLLQMLRGLGKVKEYSIASIITAITTVILNIILILKFHFTAESILISSTIANIICIIYAITKCQLFNNIKFSKINKQQLKGILSYSLPMIPNSLSWWIVSVSDRTIISIFLSTAYNGIYTVSCKFSNILNSILMIFNMSWQESASIHINDKDKNTFFSNMINAQLMLFISLSLLIIGIVPLAFKILIGIDYMSAYKYIPILLYANLWNTLIGLLGGIYVAKKRTKEIMNTTIISAIINLIVHIVLIKKIGLYAACISTAISYIVMGIYRFIDCKKYVNVKLNYKTIILSHIIFVISTILYIKNSLVLNIVNILLVSITSFFLNKKTIKYLYTQIIKKHYN